MSMELPPTQVPTEAILLARCQERLRGEAAITPQTDLLENGYLDSILVMDLVALAEKQFAVTIEFDDISPQNFRTILALRS